MNEVITLIENGSRRDVFCALRSVGHTEFYEAHAAEYHPELKFVLADYLDYKGEVYVKYGADLYRVIRVYRTGQELELTVGRASAEEVALYG
jgi:hypothetical protein